MRHWLTFAVFVLSVGLMACGPTEEDPFQWGGDRPPEAPELPHWGIDHCGIPGAPGSPWNGSIALDFELEDQFGRDVRLHHYCGRVVVVASLALSAPEAGLELEQLELLRQEFTRWELGIIGLVGEDETGDAPTTETLAAWAEAHEVGFALLADPDWEVTSRYVETPLDGTSIQLYSPGLEIEALGLGTVAASDILALLPGGGTS